jgi:ADP-ribosylation factor-like protein 6
MGLFRAFAKLLGFSKRKTKILILGLDNSGKSTLLAHLKREARGDSFEVVPTVGFTVETFHRGDIAFTAFDMSGQSRYRGLWEAYYPDVSAVVWVLDSSDKLRITMAKHELKSLLDHKEIIEKYIPVLLFANKIDQHNSLSPVECMQLLGLDEIQSKPWHITGSNAISGEGVEDGIQWLCDALLKTLRQKK